MHTLRNRSRRLVLALFVGILGSASFGSAAMSLALFTDQETDDNTFTSGTIVLNGAAIDALSLTTSAIMPGDSTTGAVVVQNDGSAQLRYSLSTSSTNADTKDLRSVLTLTVKEVDATTPGTPCDNFDGTSVLTATALTTASVGAGFGDVTAGDDTGDRDLDAAANETLCFRVSLPGTTGNAYQGAATTTTFTFDAEQTSSNP